MLSKSLAFALVAAPLALSQGVAPIDRDLSNQAASFRAGCPNLMQIEPIVLLNVSGETLLGPVQYHLAVYSNGLASFSRAATPGGVQDASGLQQTGTGSSSGLAAPNGGPPSTIAIATTVYLSINEANQLVADLHRAGAMSLCDQDVYITDVPLQTLTIMEPRPDGIAHTFSFWAGVGNYAATSAVIDNFVETYFPGL